MSTFFSLTGTGSSVSLTGTSSLSSGTTTIDSSNTWLGNSGSYLTIGSTASWSTMWTGTWISSNDNLDTHQNQIDSLKELLNLLLIINDIEIDLDEFISMDKNERIVALRDIKIKKILPHESK